MKKSGIAREEGELRLPLVMGPADEGIFGVTSHIAAQSPENEQEVSSWPASR